MTKFILKYHSYSRSILNLIYYTRKNCQITYLITAPKCESTKMNFCWFWLQKLAKIDFTPSFVNFCQFYIDFCRFWSIFQWTHWIANISILNEYKYHFRTKILFWTTKFSLFKKTKTCESSLLVKFILSNFPTYNNINCFLHNINILLISSIFISLIYFTKCFAKFTKHFAEIRSFQFVQLCW